MQKIKNKGRHFNSKKYENRAAIMVFALMMYSD